MRVEDTSGGDPSENKMGKSLFLIPSAGGGCWMSDQSEEKAGDLFAIALYLDHRCTAPEMQLNSKLHGISNL